MGWVCADATDIIAAATRADGSICESILKDVLGVDAMCERSLSIREPLGSLLQLQNDWDVHQSYLAGRVGQE